MASTWSATWPNSCTITTGARVTLSRFLSVLLPPLQLRLSITCSPLYLPIPGGAGGNECGLKPATR
eukprot:1644802-Pyramimonas_sp.AAC.1